MIILRIFVILLILLGSAHASIIRDSEIEKVIKDIVAPIKKTSGLTDLKIYIINNPTPNAFTIGGNKIFIHSGLIIDFSDPDVLRGIIAHEIGHITGHHIIRQQEVVNKYQRAAFGATILGLATAIASKSEAQETGGAIMMTGMHMAERSIYAYSRSFESSADQTAIDLLEKSSHSVIGLIHFFESMQSLTKSNMINPYDQTHPMDRDRLSVLRNFNKISKFKDSQNDNNLILRYAIVSAKLAAFTVDLNKIESLIYKNDSWEIKHYVRAIKNLRTGNFDDALTNINKLIAKHPTNPYYHELKAQIYFEFGKNSALDEYNIAIALDAKQDDTLMRLSRAIVGLSQNLDNADDINRYYQDLVLAIKEDPDNLLAMYYLAIFYEKKGMAGKSYLNTAIIAFKSGRSDDAKYLANAAIKALPKKSPEWYKANDIIALINTENYANKSKIRR